MTQECQIIKINGIHLNVKLDYFKEIELNNLFSSYKLKNIEAKELKLIVCPE